MPNYAFDHVHLHSPDPAATAAFYEKMFGAKRLNTGGGPGDSNRMINLSLNGVTILISKPMEGNTNGLVHFGVRTDNLEQAAAELKAAGVTFSRDITEVRPGFKISFLNAPENTSIELQEGSL